MLLDAMQLERTLEENDAMRTQLEQMQQELHAAHQELRDMRQERMEANHAFHIERFVLEDRCRLLRNELADVRKFNADACALGPP
jgi:uncharacterized protein (DUF3084 family)